MYPVRLSFREHKRRKSRERNAGGVKFGGSEEKISTKMASRAEGGGEFSSQSSASLMCTWTFETLARPRKLMAANATVGDSSTASMTEFSREGWEGKQ